MHEEHKVNLCTICVIRVPLRVHTSPCRCGDVPLLCKERDVLTTSKQGEVNSFNPLSGALKALA
jgi:hypothetical protein